MIQVRNLEKVFKSKAGLFYALRRINLDVARGDSCAARSSASARSTP